MKTSRAILSAFAAPGLLSGFVKEKSPVDPGPHLGNRVVGIVPPVDSAPSENCKRNQGSLLVEFRNSGAIDAPGGVDVHVTFCTNPEVVVTNPMPPIPDNQSVSMPFVIPKGCFSPDCGFAVQWSNQPSVPGLCIG